MLVVHETIHDVEIDTTEAVLRALIAEQCPQWEVAALRYLASSGTTNATWKLDLSDGTSLLARLPRTPGAAHSIGRECELLPELAATSVAAAVAIPRVMHVGQPCEALPHTWAIFEWIDGVDLWAERDHPSIDQPAFAQEIAELVAIIRTLTGLTAPVRTAGSRGGPLAELLRGLDRWLDDPQWNAHGLIDVAAVRSTAAASAEVIGEPVDTSFVHGDIIPGNLLMSDERLSALIDWGGAGYGDPAQDLSAAWSIFDGDSRRAFREAVDTDDATWLRARAFELEHAVGGVLYYVPRRHSLGDVMMRTLDRILTEHRGESM